MSIYQLTYVQFKYIRKYEVLDIYTVTNTDLVKIKFKHVCEKNIFKSIVCVKWQIIFLNQQSNKENKILCQAR